MKTNEEKLSPTKIALSQKQFTVTQDQCSLRWGGGFWCKICGLKFAPGNTARWICTSLHKEGKGMQNIFVCSGCDEEDTDKVLVRAKEEWRKAVELAKRWGIYGPDWEKENQ